MTPNPTDIANVANPFTLVYLAVIVGALARLLKTKTMGQILDSVPLSFVKSIPPRVLPWVAVALAGLIALGDARLNGHLSWKDAGLMGLLGAVLGGGSAIGGHETIAKLVGAVLPSVATKKDDDTPKPPIAGGMVTILAVWVLASGAVMVGNLGCTRQQARAVTDAAFLTIDQVLCVEGSELVEESAIAALCAIADAAPLRSVLRSLIGQRVAAKRAGFVWPGPLDAGVPDGGK